MKVSQGKFFVIAICLIICSLSLSFWAAKVHSGQSSVSLTKDESLHLMQLHFAAQAAVADRTEYARGLYTKYGLDDKAYQLNVAKGEFEVVKLDAKK